VNVKKVEKRLQEARERAAQKSAKETDREIEENKRFVAEYYKSVKDFSEEIFEQIKKSLDR